MRTAIAIVLSCCLAGLAIGCGSQDDSTPVACLEGPQAYEKALASAPGQVELDGETKISECLADNQQAGDLATVGLAMVETATALNAEARQDPGGSAALELGYLLGAAEKGAEDTEGIHTDLLRRLEVAARFAPGTTPLTARFRAGYQEGFDAGKADG